MRRVAIVTSILLFSEWACASKLLDHIRDFDLNDYAFGVAVSASQNPYLGSSSSAFVYPYLTSLRDSAFTDDWLLVREGSLGARWVKGGWELGVLGRIQTLGIGDRETNDLLGVADRNWTIEVGPLIGWRSRYLHISLKTFAEITDRHDGLISELSFSLPKEWSRGYFIPSLEFIHQSSDYSNYYYGVTDSEANQNRPAYTPTAATNLEIKARWGYILTDKWSLTGSFGVERLDSAISDSPIVDRDEIWSVGFGVAYNANLFQPKIYDDSAPSTPKFEFRVGVFQDSISTKVARDQSNGVTGFEIDIEDILGVPDSKSTLQIDAAVRFGHYHQLEFGYFEIGRHSAITLANDLNIGDELFAAGTIISTRVDARIYRVGYSYSLIRDAQKELGFMAGVHFTDFELNISADATGQTERSNAGTPLPVIGVHGSVFLGEKTTVGVKVQIFRTDFDHYRGSLNYLTFDVKYRVAEAFSIGLGYNYYGMKLTSKSDAVNGYFKIRHHGPTAFFTVGY